MVARAIRQADNSDAQDPIQPSMRAGERPMVEIPDSVTLDLAWSPDSKRIAFSAQRQPPSG
jgi:WD40-like Beta Propeller Repeat